MIQGRVIGFRGGEFPHAIIEVLVNQGLVGTVRVGREVLAAVTEDRELDEEAFLRDVQEACSSLRYFVDAEAARLGVKYPLRVWRPV